jgi:hypothetical protein
MRSLKDWADLLTLLRVSEQADLDFKKTINPQDPLEAIETAKDIAALANTQGGHIIVGADDNGVRCTGFPGISPADAKAIREHIEKAPVGRCLPTPFISVQPPIDVPGQPVQVLVVRVEMAPIAPIGVSLSQPKGGKLVVHGWCFPYRVGSQTNFLTPDQFGAYESMSARRAAALLLGIPPEDRGSLRLVYQSGGRATTTGNGMNRRVRLQSVSPRENVAQFMLLDGPQEHSFDVPLDEVATVWKAVDAWQVAVRGYLHVGARSESAQYLSAC